jgi:tRNA-binding protein
MRRFCLMVATTRAARAEPIGKERAMAEQSSDLAFEDFLKVNIRLGTIVRAEPYEQARKPAIKLWIDFGAEIGQRKTSAQITTHYDPETLSGRQVMAVINFPPKQIGKFMSECLVLGFSDGEGGGIILAQPDKPAPNGARLH